MKLQSFLLSVVMACIIYAVPAHAAKETSKNAGGSSPMSKHVIVHTDKAPAAIGPYSQAVVYNGIVYTSGQISLSPANGEIVGKNITEQSEQCMKNLKAVLEAANSSLTNVVKTTVFLSSMDDFAAFNTVYTKYFTSNFPARSCVAVKTLPKNLLIEIEAVAYQK